MVSPLEKLYPILQSAVEGMSATQLLWHQPGKWSAAEILEHLFLSYTGTIAGLKRVLSEGKLLASRPSAVHRVKTLLVIELGYMPHGVKAPAIVEPKGLPFEKVREEIGAKIREMNALIAQCEARFGRQTKILDHPILGPLNTRQWRKLHLVHGRHHVKQLVGLRERMR